MGQKKLRSAAQNGAIAEALECVADAASFLHQAEENVNKRRDHLCANIHAAHSAGASVEELQNVLGVSRARVYQLLASVRPK